MREKLSNQGQSGIEYLLILAVVVALVMISFKTMLPKVFTSSNVYFNEAAKGVMGPGPRCGNGQCETLYNESIDTCCVDCGGCCSGMPCTY